jgi:hypothetical protein
MRETFAQTIAIERNLKTLGQLETEFSLIRAKTEDFFPEWQEDLLELSATTQSSLDEYDVLAILQKFGEQIKHD